jgi:hypothetical protein
MNSSSAINDSVPNTSSGSPAPMLVAIVWKSSDPNVITSSSMPRMKAKSPTRLTTKAFFAASAAEGFW